MNGTFNGLDVYDVAPVRRLVENAFDELRPDNPDIERAMWRLVDAAGLLAASFPDAIGVCGPTGRGFQIVDTRRTK